jgi:glycolate oxidase iron-sulfur subunit
VHCGFCTATCPTYQLLGDELDGPRGRIYLIKQVLEGHAHAQTQLHLDRCLTCRNCESTCPSGVQYGHLVDIGRKIVDEQVPRPRASAPRAGRSRRPALAAVRPAMRWARRCAAAARCLRAKVPRAGRGRWPTREHARKVLLLAGCVQPRWRPTSTPPPRAC